MDSVNALIAIFVLLAGATALWGSIVQMYRGRIEELKQENLKLETRTAECERNFAQLWKQLQHARTQWDLTQQKNQTLTIEIVNVRAELRELTNRSSSLKGNEDD